MEGVQVFATAEPTSTITSSLSTVTSALASGASELGAQAISVITTILPIGLGILGAGVLINLGFKWIKRATGK